LAGLQAVSQGRSTVVIMRAGRCPLSFSVPPQTSIPVIRILKSIVPHVLGDSAFLVLAVHTTSSLLFSISNIDDMTSTTVKASQSGRPRPECSLIVLRGGDNDATSRERKNVLKIWRVKLLAALQGVAWTQRVSGLELLVSFPD
jgi:hypothetical protein